MPMPILHSKLRSSLGSRLFLRVLGAALAALSGTSYLSYRALEHHAHQQIQSQLSTQTTQIETQLGKIEAYSAGLAIAVKANHQAQITSRQTAEQLAFAYFQQRPELIMAIGFGQTPYALQSEREWLYHYFYLDQGVEAAKGRFLPAPHDNVRYSELFADDRYPERDYYKLPTQSGKPLWVQPYDWYGVTMTSFMHPIVSDQGKILGVVGSDVNVSAIGQLIKLPVMNQQGYYAILSEQGNLLGYPPDPTQARALADYTKIPGFTNLWQQAQQHTAGLSQMNGQIWAYRRMKGTNWLMIATVPQAAVLQPILISTALGTLGAITFLAIVVALFVRRVNRRLNPIVQTCHQLQAQYVSTEITTTTQYQQTGDEFTVLATTVNQMSAQLQLAFSDLAASNEILEQRVAERTETLSQTLQDLQTTQLQMVQSEKMSALGNLVAGIAHEINNPIGFIGGNLSPAQTYVNQLLELVDLYQTQYPEPNVAIDTQIEAIDLAYVRQDVMQLLKSMHLGVDRIREISTSLRTFSRADTDRPTRFNLHNGIDSTLMILKHRLKANEQRPEIVVIKQYGNLPQVECFAGQLNQVFMNLLANAIDAFDEQNQGKHFSEIEQNRNCITITTFADVEHVVIKIADNGSGIPENVQSKIFDHLFTTKAVGQGTGLGLSIVHQIITATHQGKINVASTIGEGSTFVLTLPIQTPVPSPSEGEG
jgi:signal transduction histidine kinase